MAAASRQPVTDGKCQKNCWRDLLRKGEKKNYHCDVQPLRYSQLPFKKASVYSAFQHNLSSTIYNITNKDFLTYAFLVILFAATSFFRLQVPSVLTAANHLPPSNTLVSTKLFLSSFTPSTNFLLCHDLKSSTVIFSTVHRDSCPTSSVGPSISQADGETLRTLMLPHLQLSCHICRKNAVKVEFVVNTLV